jgi:hypothetical protein
MVGGLWRKATEMPAGVEAEFGFARSGVRPVYTTRESEIVSIWIVV